MTLSQLFPHRVHLSRLTNKSASSGGLNQVDRVATQLHVAKFSSQPSTINHQPSTISTSSSVHDALLWSQTVSWLVNSSVAASSFSSQLNKLSRDSSVLVITLDSILFYSASPEIILPDSWTLARKWARGFSVYVYTLIGSFPTIDKTCFTFHCEWLNVAQWTLSHLAGRTSSLLKGSKLKIALFGLSLGTTMSATSTDQLYQLSVRASSELHKVGSVSWAFSVWSKDRSVHFWLQLEPQQSQHVIGSLESLHTLKLHPARSLEKSTAATK